MERRRRTVAKAFGAAWLGALIVVVAATMATRSEFAGTNSSAGPILVLLTVPAILLATWRLRDPIVSPLTFIAAAAVSCVIAANVLRDESSTAALGIPAPAVYAVLAVGVGIAVQAFITPTQSPKSN